MAAELTFAPPSGHWDGQLLEPVAEINEQMLEALKLTAAAYDDEARPPPLLRADWCRLDGAAQRRLASCPYLLLDAGFAQPERWEHARGAVMDAPSRGSALAGGAGIALVRRTLLLAWHVARSNRLMSRVVLGMTLRTAERIASSRLRDLEALAELCPAWIGPRWQQQPQVWQQLIAAAASDDPVQLRLAQLRGLQLLAGALSRRGARAA